MRYLCRFYDTVRSSKTTETYFAAKCFGRNNRLLSNVCACVAIAFNKLIYSRNSAGKCPKLIYFTCTCIIIVLTTYKCFVINIDIFHYHIYTIDQTDALAETEKFVVELITKTHSFVLKSTENLLQGE
jgi:hypothetical protein